MAFERLGDVIDRVLAASGIDVGNGAAATAPNAGKGAPTEAGASLEVRQQYAEARHGRWINDEVQPTIGRGMTTASPTSAPQRSAVVIPLPIRNKGGSRGREVTTPAAYRAAVRGGDARETVLKLVHARPS